MKKLKIYIGLLLFLLAMPSGNSQPLFYSQSLQNLYNSLPISCRLNTTATDTVIYCSEIVPDGAASIVFCWDKYEILVHIGYRFLHDDEMRQIFNPAVIRFLEREILALLATGNLNQKLAMNRDNGMFVALNGNTPQTEFYRSRTGLQYLLQYVSGMEVHYENQQRYRVDIYCGENQTLTFYFVADAELLSDMDKKERDDRIAAQLSSHRSEPQNLSQHILLCNEETLQVHRDSTDMDSIFVCTGRSFIIPQINNNVYYTKIDDEFKLIFGKYWIKETFSNVMLALSETNYTMQITHRVYGGIVHNYELNSRDFFDYFSNDYEHYFGIETFDKDILTGMLVMADKDAGSIHLAFVSISILDLLAGGTMKIQLDTNIPQHNIETLFGIKDESGKNNQKYKINIR